MSSEYIPAIIVLAGLSIPFFGAFCHDCYRVREARVRVRSYDPDHRTLSE